MDDGKEVEVSQHGQKRVRQRIGTKNAEELASDALKLGFNVIEAKGHLKSYMNSLGFKHNVERAKMGLSRIYGQVLVYKDNIFIFNGNTLVTTFPLPGNLRRLAKSIAEQKIGVKSVSNPAKKRIKPANRKKSSHQDAPQHIKENNQDLTVPLLSPELAALLSESLGK